MTRLFRIAFALLKCALCAPATIQGDGSVLLRRNRPVKDHPTALFRREARIDSKDSTGKIGLKPNKLQRSWTGCKKTWDPPLKAGESFHGYILMDCLGDGAYSQVWSARHPLVISGEEGEGSIEKAPAEVVVKLVRDDSGYSLSDMQKECAFALLAQKKAGAHITRCMDVGQAQMTTGAVPFIILEVATGQSLHSMANASKLRSLGHAFSIAMEIHALLNMLRSPTNGTLLWHRDLTLHNLFLQTDKQNAHLTAVDYNGNDMCCIDKDCDPTLNRLTRSMHSMSHPPSKIELQTMVKPCSDLDPQKKGELDRLLILAWARDVLGLLYEEALSLSDWEAMHWQMHNVRDDYSREWFECQVNRGPCEKAIEDVSLAFQLCEDPSNYPERMRPQWPGTTQDSLRSLRQAKDLLVSSEQLVALKLERGVPPVASETENRSIGAHLQAPAAELERSWERCGQKQIPIQAGDAIHGYTLIECLGAGAHSEVWSAEQVKKNSKVANQAVVKLMKVSANSARKDFYKECVFARIAKQRLGGEATDCIDVGEAVLKNKTIPFITLEKAEGKGFNFFANWKHQSAELQKLGQAFSVALQIHSLIDKLRTQARGMILWDLDMFLYNLFLRMSLS